jgi:hypothetical protein
MGGARGALWLWHAPPPFEAALESEAVHYLQHLTLLVTALLFWASLLPRRADTRSRIMAVFSLFTTSIHATLLGALLTLSPTVWYASYAGAEESGGLSALEDQQLAGLVKWVPFCLGAAHRGPARGPRADAARHGPARRSAVADTDWHSGGGGAAPAKRTGSHARAGRLHGGNPERGRETIRQNGCPTCHIITGIKEARGQGGPPLDHFAKRVYIAVFCRTRPTTSWPGSKTHPESIP